MSEKYTFRELIRNNCSCCADVKACDICNIDDQVILAFKEWIEQKRQFHLNRKNITDREADIDLQRALFIDELLLECSVQKDGDGKSE